MVEKIEVEKEEFFSIIKKVSDKYPHQFQSEYNTWLCPLTVFFYFEDKLLGYSIIPGYSTIVDVWTEKIPEASEFYLEEQLYERFKEEFSSKEE